VTRLLRAVTTFPTVLPPSWGSFKRFIREKTTRKYCVQMLRNWTPYNWPYKTCRSMYTMIYYYAPLSNESASAGSKSVKFDVEPENGLIPISNWNYACIHTLIIINIHWHIHIHPSRTRFVKAFYQIISVSQAFTKLDKLPVSVKLHEHWAAATFSTPPELGSGCKLGNTSALNLHESSWIFILNPGRAKTF